MPTYILIVDDNPVTADLIRRHLTASGRTIVAARTLAEARAHLGSGPTPDLAIVDRMLPDGSGLVFCEDLRAAYPTLPLIVLTGRPPRPGHPVAADLVLTKPFSAADVRFAVARLLATSIPD